VPWRTWFPLPSAAASRDGGAIRIPRTTLLFPKCSCRREKVPLLCRQAGRDMVQRVTTVAFEGIEIRPVDVQVQVAPGMPAFTMV
jgi:hypothetical protein